MRLLLMSITALLILPLSSSTPSIHFTFQLLDWRQILQITGMLFPKVLLVFLPSVALRA